MKHWVPLFLIRPVLLESRRRGHIRKILNQMHIPNIIRLSSNTRETNAAEIHIRQLTVEGEDCLNFSDYICIILDLGFS